MGYLQGSNTFGWVANANMNTTTKGIFMTSEGNVGIGTTNPAAKLDVNGNLILQGGNIMDHQLFLSIRVVVVMLIL